MSCARQQMPLSYLARAFWLLMRALVRGYVLMFADDMNVI